MYGGGMLRASVLFFVLLCSLPFAVFAAETRSPSPMAARIEVDPSEVRLSGPEARYTLLVTGRGAGGREFDLTHAAQYRSLSPSVVGVSSGGVVHGVKDGI